MDSLLPSLDASAKSTGLSGLLSSLSDLLAGSAASPEVFAQFLEQNQIPAPPAQVPSPPVTPGPSESNDTGVSSADAASNYESTPNVPNAPSLQATGSQAPSSIPLLKKIVTEVHHILEQLNQQGKGKSSQQENPTNNAPATAGASPAQLPGQAAPTSGNAGQANTDPANAAASSDGSSGTSGVAGDAQTLAQIVLQLVALMKGIENKLATIQAGAGTSASISTPGSLSNSTATLATNASPGLAAVLAATVNGGGQIQAPAITDSQIPDPTQAASNAGDTQAGVADTLTRLLALIQTIEKKLANSSSDVLPTSSAPSLLSLYPDAVQTAAPIPSFSQIEKNLKTLLNSLQNAVTIGAPADKTSSANIVNNSGVPDAPTDPSDTAPVSGQKTDPTPPKDPSVFAPLNDLSNLFSAKANNVFATTTGTDANALASGNISFMPETSAGGKDGGLLDGNANDNPTLSANTQNAAADNPALASLSDGASASNPYSFASQLSALRATNGGMTGLPSAVEQVLLQLNRGVKGGNDQMTIQLQPADLGKISIKLDIAANGKVQGTVVADNPATLSLLVKDVRSLERALQEAGLRADPGSLQFSLGGQSGNTPGQTANNFASNASTTSNSSFDTTVNVPDTSTDADEIWYLTPGRVNFKV